MAIVEGADGFQWEDNTGTKEKPLAGGAGREYWRKIENQPGGWWRITREDDGGNQLNFKYYLRQWKEDESGNRRLLSHGFAPDDTLPRAQESARYQELMMSPAE